MEASGQVVVFVTDDHANQRVAQIISLPISELHPGL